MEERKVAQKNNIKEKIWKDEENLWRKGNEARHLEDGLLQDKWRKATTRSAHTLKIRPTNESTQVSLNTLTEFLYFQNSM